MPRRNQRNQVHEPLDLTPRDVAPTRPRRDHFTSGDEWQKARIRHEVETAKRQRNARINGGIDWSICLVPGCGEQLIVFGMPFHSDSKFRDHTIALPLCIDHLAVAKQQHEDERSRVHFTALGAILDGLKRRKIDEDVEERQRRHLQDTDQGDIYYLRQNGLIKVGWSRDVDRRLKSYGPNVEVLCVHPGSHHDEQELHHALTPARARGREWYEDGPILQDFIGRALATYGPPEVYTTWTRPNPRATAPKRRR